MAPVGSRAVMWTSGAGEQASTPFLQGSVCADLCAGFTLLYCLLPGPTAPFHASLKEVVFWRAGAMPLLFTAVPMPTRASNSAWPAGEAASVTACTQCFVPERPSGRTDVGHEFLQNQSLWLESCTITNLSSVITCHPGAGDCISFPRPTGGPM